VIRYQTEVIVPPDRYLCLQLPAHLPEGRVTVTVIADEPEPAEVLAAPEPDLDRQDIEWWEEFDGP
jgi:hypothetical protein